MGRSFVSQKDASALGGFAFGLALHEPRDTGRQKCHVTLLPRHDIGQVLNGAGQMCDLFLKACDVIHVPQIGRTGLEIKPRSSPVVALARAPR